jgi:hypothetical protein
VGQFLGTLLEQIVFLLVLFFFLACGHLLHPPEAVYHFALLSVTVVLGVAM